MPGRRTLNFIRLTGAALGAGLLAGCASAPGPVAEGTASWRKLTQVEQSFAIFMENPAPAPVEGLATFRFVYVYAPGAVQHEGQEVSWQEYSAMTVNCAQDTVRTGPRLRYAPDGAVITSDENQEFADIIGPAIRRAAGGACRGVTAPEQVLIPDGADWREAARASIASGEPF
ncbi:MAG: hypothetical protein CVT79_17060 [Alphaproteobacteria bacterium HGW-Alphaproteobacteria-18]|nr:MAG: hypothetical protein CVT79_17060 [Alphaproteobacteria bacterium HGW-Alphaproteobacteria-18]